VRREWRNWARDQRCRPQAIETPSNRDELAELVKGAAGGGRRVRVAGSGHSFSDIALTEGLMLRLERLDRVLAADRASGRVKVEAGIVLSELNRRLEELGLALENLGDIDRQTLAGSISTATHGTGERFQNLSAQIERSSSCSQTAAPWRSRPIQIPTAFARPASASARSAWSTRSPSAPSPPIR
jgi:L-gulono-1,4-lactone dehydrogenase